jgi:putative transposase
MLTFFVVPTITFQLLFVFVILDHDRRRPIHFAVTSNPTAGWTARSLFEAFPCGNPPDHLVRDRDSIYGEVLWDSETDGYSGKS